MLWPRRPRISCCRWYRAKSARWPTQTKWNSKFRTASRERISRKSETSCCTRIHNTTFLIWWSRTRDRAQTRRACLSSNRRSSVRPLLSTSEDGRSGLERISVFSGSLATGTQLTFFFLKSTASECRLRERSDTLCLYNNNHKREAQTQVRCWLNWWCPMARNYDKPSNLIEAHTSLINFRGLATACYTQI